MIYWGNIDHCDVPCGIKRTIASLDTHDRERELTATSSERLPVKPEATINDSSEPTIK